MAEQPGSARVKLEKVVKTFGDQTVIHGIDLDISPGHLTTLLGPSGCGKTTVLRLIAGLELPSAGRIFIGDEDVSVLSASRRDVAMVFQSYALFPHMTVGENVGYGLKVQRVAADLRRDKVARSLDAVGLSGLGDRYIDQLSGGQQQRVAVARALILEPKVMLFDEPLSNLDTKLRRQMREDIRRLQQETGITSVYVTHDQSEALSVSDQVVVMNEGLIAQMGPPEELYRRPNSSFVATFMGDANIVDGIAEKSGDGVTVILGGHHIELAIDVRDVPTGPVKVAIRPESLHLAPAGGADDRPMGTVTSRAYTGSATEYTLSWQDQDLLAIVPAGTTVFAPGEEVQLVIDPVGVAPIRD